MPRVAGAFLLLRGGRWGWGSSVVLLCGLALWFSSRESGVYQVGVLLQDAE